MLIFNNIFSWAVALKRMLWINKLGMLWSLVWKSELCLKNCIIKLFRKLLSFKPSHPLPSILNLSNTRVSVFLMRLLIRSASIHLGRPGLSGLHSPLPLRFRDHLFLFNLYPSPSQNKTYIYLPSPANLFNFITCFESWVNKIWTRLHHSPRVNQTIKMTAMIFQNLSPEWPPIFPIRAR